jgi:isopenicillin N synthase-like dioxygenase
MDAVDILIPLRTRTQPMTTDRSSYATASCLATDALPVIDIGPLRDGSDPEGVAAALHRASRDVGFLYVANHGIPAALLALAQTQAMAFFRRPLGDKRSVTISAQHRGFLSMGAARMQQGMLPDLKESFVWGYEDALGQTPQDHPLRGANQWPKDMPELRAAALAFSTQADAVARQLLEGFALGLGQAPAFFLQTSSRPMSRAAFVYYPAQPVSSGAEQFGVGPHTDFGVLTVLCQDGTGGLQVQHADGRWVHAPPIADTLVVNVGDLLARWTGNRYRSTPHRVVNRSGRERLSLVLAFDPDPDTLIDPQALFPDAPAIDAPIRCGDYLQWRFGQSFDYRKPAATNPT